MISDVIALIRGGLSLYSEKRAAINAREIQEIKTGAAWEVKALDSGVWIRRFSYGLFSFPIVLTAFNPGAGRELFANLSAAPDWYIQTFMIINGTVWGALELKRIIPAFAGLKK
ncbi:hypothetical protein [Aestuariibacter sp. A3R04]|uniref:hypothetical protein n=1 Tax=Aestuariibacter sp. A3R04 TaxID=2841571 RepID=UPI001C09EAA0|nr:hypothetical protein [Aestuariibacter sp. A3R04]MBU3022883.1 hypothetical protein [Aestuariibacter sp. A3R04]